MPYQPDNQNRTTDIRTCAGFAADTQCFGFDLTAIADLDPSRTANIDVSDVAMTGASGSEILFVSGNGRFGFGDVSIGASLQGRRPGSAGAAADLRASFRRA